ncbi:MAG: hypothetical protein Q3983_02515 [Capnocytophaga sp.]|nr:hypothetical protein [Capnocytophaga sp.]
MSKNLLFIFVLFLSIFVYSQKGTNSPYSYYGLGTIRFSGNTENALMGGITAYSDSTRVDVRNPASLGKLLFTTYSLGLGADFRTMKTNTTSYSTKTTTIDYLALSFPVYKKVGVSLGLYPYSSVGYKLSSQENRNGDNQILTFEGNGGLNRVYIATGYEIYEGLRIGAGVYFNFGKTDIENLHQVQGGTYLTREQNSSSLRGTNFNFGAEYERKISDKLTLSTTFSYLPKATITSTNSRSLSTLQYNSQGNLLVKESQTIDLGNDEKTNLVIPSQFNIGAGVGENQNWFAAVDYTLINNNEYSNPFITSTFVEYKKGYRVSLGGFYLPDYKSFTSYWKRVVYRLGFHYENTGISLKNEDITDFGISFGVSLPVRGFSNVTVGAIYGKKGTLAQNLVKENYIALKIALTLNDKWFQKSKYN